MSAEEGTLQDYLRLEQPVSIGAALFSDFRQLPIEPGANSTRSDFIDVRPLEGESTFGFAIEPGLSAVSTDLFQVRFSFRVANVFLDGAELTLAGSETRGTDGMVTTTVSFSEPGEDTGSSGVLTAMIDPEDTLDPQASIDLQPADELIVEVNAVVDGGERGGASQTTAFLERITLRFQEAQMEPTPLRIVDAGLVDPDTYFIEFTSEPGATHLITRSQNLVDGFEMPVSLVDGDGETDQNGFERVEFQIGSYGPSEFFRVETDF